MALNQQRLQEWPSYAERCKLEETKQFFEDHGYIHCADYLSQKEMSILLQEIERYKQEVVPTLPPTATFYEDKSKPTETIIRCDGMDKYDDFFAALCASSAFNGLVDCLLGEPCEPNNMQFFCKPPGAKETPPHQDGQYFMHGRGVTLWLALGTATEENGCMFYADASHKLGLLEHVKTEQLGFSQKLKDYPRELVDCEKCMPAESGCLLGHHPYTVHRANPNTTKDGQWRPALGLTYWATACRHDDDLHKRRADYRAKLMQELEDEGKI